jgi:hypothetical protein
MIPIGSTALARRRLQGAGLRAPPMLDRSPAKYPTVNGFSSPVVGQKDCISFAVAIAAALGNAGGPLFPPAALTAHEQTKTNWLHSPASEAP